MRVTFERSGGFAAISRRQELDTDTMSSDEAERLRTLVDAARFFSQPRDVTGPPAARRAQPDRFNYVITVTDGDRRHTVRFGEPDMPPEMNELVQFLSAAGRSESPGS